MHNIHPSKKNNKIKPLTVEDIYLVKKKSSPKLLSVNPLEENVKNNDNQEQTQYNHNYYQIDNKLKNKTNKKNNANHPKKVTNQSHKLNNDFKFYKNKTLNSNKSFSNRLDTSFFNTNEKLNTPSKKSIFSQHSSTKIINKKNKIKLKTTNFDTAENDKKIKFSPPSLSINNRIKYLEQWLTDITPLESLSIMDKQGHSLYCSKNLKTHDIKYFQILFQFWKIHTNTLTEKKKNKNYDENFIQSSQIDINQKILKLTFSKKNSLYIVKSHNFGTTYYLCLEINTKYIQKIPTNISELFNITLDCDNSIIIL